MQALRIDVRSSYEMQRIGELIGKAVQGGEVLALYGDLGAGKTTLVQGIAAGMGVDARVTSPTFILLNEYTGAAGRRLVHVDTYRLAEEIILAEAATFGLEDLLAGEFGAKDVVAIEWADRIEALLPDDVLRIEITAGDDDPDVRTIRMRASGERSTLLLENLQI
ncbi:MAG: tRNA (adenosine(37)-N6)-threonylcarbamoyltransferase complex ATPase subunit type 1 TsaE [Caldilinea sp.]